jgi:hypothetical protein
MQRCNDAAMVMVMMFRDEHILQLLCIIHGMYLLHGHYDLHQVLPLIGMRAYS